MLIDSKVDDIWLAQSAGGGGGGGWLGGGFGGGSGEKTARFEAEDGSVDVAPALRHLAAVLTASTSTAAVGALPGLDDFARIAVARRLVSAGLLRVVDDDDDGGGGGLEDA